MSIKKKVYLAGPMRGVPEFNFPQFFVAAKKLEEAGFVVFNPAARDNQRHGTDVSQGNLTGDMEQLNKEHGFDLRVALHEDLSFICLEADMIAMLPRWQNSKGATAERAMAIAIGLEIVWLRADGEIFYHE